MSQYEVPMPVLDDNDILPAEDTKDGLYVDEKVEAAPRQLSEEERHAVSARAESQGIALATDFDHVVDEMMTLTDDQAVELLLEAMDIHDGDPNFPAASMTRITALIQGYKANDMSEADWSFSVRAEAAIIFFHSPYPEVRAVTDPHDDENTPCETIRIYILGSLFVLGSTALNSFFHPRQPAITLGPNVLQLLMLPCGMFCAKVLPDWGFNFRGSRWSLNPGPWSFKEQVLANIFFDMTSGYSNLYDVLLVQKLPVYLKQSWVSYGYEILMALAIQAIGFSYAGILRRFAVFPTTMMWPSVLPTLALSRALTMPEKRERVNGWKIRRYQWFCIVGICSFAWFWVPNYLFQALHAFNWMTWIAPDNFNLAAVTGFYGGMGFNPWASFDWNVWGKSSLVTPFFSTFQSTIGMMLGGMIILAQSYSNHYGTSYMPPNSNTVYNREAKPYNVSAVLTENGDLDVAKYEAYGPPFWASFNIFHNGQSYAWCTMIIVYISIRYWTQLSKAFKGIWKSLYTTQSVYDGFEHDAQIRIYRKYKEVPEWWFLVMLVLGLGMTFGAVEGWPTQTPWWAMIFTLVFTAIVIVPMTFIVAQANVSIESAAILQLLSSMMFPGKAQTLLIFAAFGTNNLDQSRTYANDVKLGLYARIPPRTLFRAQLLSVTLQSFVFVSVINWLTASFDPQTFCTAANVNHFVCNSATQHFAVAVESGLMGAGVLFDLYPILPWCFLLGLVLGLVWGFTEKFGYRVVEWSQRRNKERTHAWLRKYIFVPISCIGYVQPQVLWAGAHLWGGASNLSYYLQSLYASFIFMYFIKRRYPAWWEKYNYLLQQGLDVGVALSGLVQILATKFGPHPITPPVWWGNTVSTAGMDFKIYNSKASYKTLPKGGHIGPPVGHFPKPGRG